MSPYQHLLDDTLPTSAEPVVWFCKETSIRTRDLTLSVIEQAPPITQCRSQCRTDSSCSQTRLWILHVKPLKVWNPFYSVHKSKWLWHVHAMQCSNCHATGHWYTVIFYPTNSDLQDPLERPILTSLANVHHPSRMMQNGLAWDWY